MIRFLNFSFFGDSFYAEKTSVPLGTSGLVYFKGLNHDGKVEDLSNGTGKTRLAQLLEAFIYSSNTDRGYFKRMVTPQFEGDLVFEDTRTGVKWQFHFDLKENAWVIRMNDQIKEVSHKPSDCQAFLQKQLGLSHSDWNYFVYIDQNSVRTLIRGKPAERRAYLEEFFNIDAFYAEQKEIYDNLVTGLEAQIQLLDQDKIRLGQLRDNLDKLPGEEWLKTQIDFADDSVIQIRKDIKKLEVTKRDVEKKIVLWKDYESLHNEFSEPDALKMPKAKNLQETVESLLEKRSKIREAIDAKKELEKLVVGKLLPFEKQKPPEPPSEPIVPDPDGSTLAEKGALLAQMREKIKLKKKIKTIQEELAAFPEFKETRYNEEEEEIRAKVAKLDFHLQLLKESKSGNCPRCGETLSVLRNSDVKELSEIIAQMKSDKSSLLDRRAEIQVQLELLKAYDDKTSLLKTLNSDYESYPDFGTKLSLAEEELQKLQETSAEWKNWRIVKNKYDSWKKAYDELLNKAVSLGYPDRLDENKEEELSSLDVELEEVKIKLEKVKRFETLSTMLIEQNVESQEVLASSLEETDFGLTEWSKRIEDLSVFKGECTNKFKQVQEFQSNVAVLDAGLANYDELKKNFRITEAIADFFSPKGFKIYEMKKRCGLLIEKANQWSSLCFQEPYIWSLSPELDNLDFLIQPVNHKSVEPYSCSKLSGGEVNRASRVLLFSQLQMIPPNKKTNLLILDEIEVNLDQAGLVAFTDEVLPKLKETFPDKTLVVISHQSKLKTSEAVDHLWLAERKNRKTTLKVYPFYNRRRFS